MSIFAEKSGPGMLLGMLGIDPEQIFKAATELQEMAKTLVAKVEAQEHTIKMLDSYLMDMRDQLNDMHDQMNRIEMLVEATNELAA